MPESFQMETLQNWPKMQASRNGSFSPLTNLVTGVTFLVKKLLAFELCEVFLGQKLPLGTRVTAGSNFYG